MTGSSLPRAGQLGEVARVLGQRLVLALGLRDRSRAACRAPPPAPSSARPCARRRPSAPGWRRRNPCSTSASSRCSLETYSSLNSLDWRVASSIRSLSRLPSVDVGRGAADLRLRVQRLGHRLPDNGRVGAELAEDRARDAVGLVEQRGEDVFRRQLLMSAAGGQLVRRLQRFLGLDCQLVESHCADEPRLSTDGNVTRLAAASARGHRRGARTGWDCAAVRSRFIRMSYLVLARKYRPQRFSELVGQEHVARTLSNAIAQNRVHHAFLFTGARGVGKTSAARILAKALSCEKGPTAEPCGTATSARRSPAAVPSTSSRSTRASNTKVEETKSILEGVRYLPARARRKVYIIDEVHMLSAHSFNALLKTLEEPPPHVVFVFATTEVHKIPGHDPVALPALRLQADLDGAAGRAPGRHPARPRRSRPTPDAVRLIARQAAGSVRDGLSLLDQAIAYVGARDADRRGDRRRAGRRRPTAARRAGRARRWTATPGRRCA